MVERIYVEKKPGFEVEAQHLLREFRTILGIEALTGLRLFNRYDVEGISAELFNQCVSTVFSEPFVDQVFSELPDECAAQADQGDGAVQGAFVVAVEFLPGQFDQRAESASECIQLISQGERPQVRSAKVYALFGELSQGEKAAIEHYLINPVEARAASLDKPTTLSTVIPDPGAVETVEGFTDLDEAGLARFREERGLAMDVADLVFFQQYFIDEGRNPTITEIKVVDTYWSDHCRHTTFGTQLDEITFEDSVVQAAFDTYLEMRRELGRTEKPICLMDMGTIGAKFLKARGIMTGVDESEEVNACTVKVTVDVDGTDEDWLFLFKNETHNHPTEIEPFGGAATCVGGAIRDPLSGRSYVYQAMRVTGAANPLTPVSETIPGKLPQRQLVVTAAQGYSSYGNQIGLATGQVYEWYHPGYVAKRMEVGAVLGATPACHVLREEPAFGDKIILLGGRTGRDGIGGATGSSKSHNVESVETAGAEVQKGNAPVERKIQRLFRRGEVCRLIKRCNDFGAGGVSVAVGELAEGLLIELDNVPKKYEGLDGTELAISESQERMAVALAPQDVESFITYAHEENLEASVIATVTQEKRLRMVWRGETIVDVSREFLASNGAPKHMTAWVDARKRYVPAWMAGAADGAMVGVAGAGSAVAEVGAASAADAAAGTGGAAAGTGGAAGLPTVKERMMALLSDLNVASNKGLAERFDSTIGAGTVLMPFGGTTQLTPSQAMVAKFPVLGETTTVSAMAWGFNPYLMEKDQFAGAYLAVVESVAKLIATGFTRAHAYLSFQEYFEKLAEDPHRWGKPVAAVLGALMAQIDIGVGAIGGKDSMSGSFEDLDVPPTLISFAVSTGKIDSVVSPEFKQVGSHVVCIDPAVYGDDWRPDPAGLCEVFDVIEALTTAGDALAIATPGYGGAAEAMFKMCVGNRIGLSVDSHVPVDTQFNPAYGSFIVELAEGACIPAHTDAIHVHEVGVTTQAYELVLGGEAMDLAELQEVWEEGIASVFPYRSVGQAENMKAAGGAAGGATGTAGGATDTGGATGATSAVGVAGTMDATVDVGCTASAATSTVEALSYADALPLTLNLLGGPIAHPRVVIPVFPGTNCEYDTAAAFERAGAQPTTLIINNLNATAVAESTQILVEAIKRSQIIMLPGGFSGGDEPDGSAKFIASFFRAPEVTEAVRDLLQNRDGLMLGICNGFQALVKLGLVPYGDIVPMQDIACTLTFNAIGRHQSKLVTTRVASSLSPWLSRCEVGDLHTIAISHGEGRFVADDDLLAKLVARGQVAAQYTDAQGSPSMDLSVNPNGSVLAIEGITSPDGRVLGKMGHTERNGAGLYQNVGGNTFQPLIESGVGYFTD